MRLRSHGAIIGRRKLGAWNWYGNASEARPPDSISRKVDVAAPRDSQATLLDGKAIQVGSESSHEIQLESRLAKQLAPRRLHEPTRPPHHGGASRAERSLAARCKPRCSTCGPLLDGDYSLARRPGSSSSSSSSSVHNWAALVVAASKWRATIDEGRCRSPGCVAVARLGFAPARASSSLKPGSLGQTATTTWNALNSRTRLELVLPDSLATNWAPQTMISLWKGLCWLA